MKTLLAIPSKSGNGFVEGMAYRFYRKKNGLYECNEVSGTTRLEGFDLDKKVQEVSAHLWDGKNWDEAGRFKIIEVSG